ncbi:hypothetical protein D3C80_1984060 [compost metagenome]
MFTQQSGEVLHLVGKGLIVVFHCFGPDIAARGQHMAVLGYFSQSHAAAEARDIGVFRYLTTEV